MAVFPHWPVAFGLSWLLAAAQYFPPVVRGSSPFNNETETRSLFCSILHWAITGDVEEGIDGALNVIREGALGQSIESNIMEQGGKGKMDYSLEDCCPGCGNSMAPDEWMMKLLKDCVLQGKKKRKVLRTNEWVNVKNRLLFPSRNNHRACSNSLTIKTRGVFICHKSTCSVGSLDFSLGYVHLIRPSALLLLDFPAHSRKPHCFSLSEALAPPLMINSHRWRLGRFFSPILLNQIINQLD